MRAARRKWKLQASPLRRYRLGKRVSNSSSQSGAVSRRGFVRRCALGAAALAATPMLGCRSPRSLSQAQRGPVSRTIPLDRDWLFGGELHPSAAAVGGDEAQWARICLPHCATKLSWQNWDPTAWQKVWNYRRHFAWPAEWHGQRAFLHFDGVMVGAAPSVNGRPLPPHLGGYLPFQYEITDVLFRGDNLLSVAVDSRWSNVPPEGASVGAKRVDYLEAGGLYRSVHLSVVPSTFIRDVFAKAVRVLEADRCIEVVATIDAAALARKPMRLEAELRQGDRVLARAQAAVPIDGPGTKPVALTLSHLGNVALWDVQKPNLCTVVATLFEADKPLHNYRVRIGLREARFATDGFYLNGRRLQLFGLNRHEIFPYVGGAMPPRVMRRDAELLRQRLNCNFVRCSHYPQSEAFLDACDELGLMVWEEVPGWGYIGDAAWKELLVRDVKDMILRDRNHPAIVIWGTRANESANEVELYHRTKTLAKALDDSRPTSGSMTSGSRKDWKRLVFSRVSASRLSTVLEMRKMVWAQR